MTDSSEWIWIRIRRRAAIAIAGLLREAATKLHFEATLNKPKAKELRETADDAHYVGKQIERHIFHGGPVNDESVHGNSAPVQITRFSLPKDARELMIATVIAFSIVSNIYIYTHMNERLEEVTSKLHDAYKDIQTQVWVKQDKEEEKFQKFVAGPYAALAGELKANEILIQQCKEKH